MSKNGEKCKRRQYLPFDVCWQHLRINYNLTIKKTSLEGYNFKGLFAYDYKNPENKKKIVFRKKKGRKQRSSDRIIRYIGEKLTKHQIDERYSEYENATAPYAFKTLKKNSYIDSACKRGAGSFANTKPNAQNARLSRTGSLYATKNIKNGEEIFVSYGRQYKFKDARCNTHNTRYKKK